MGKRTAAVLLLLSLQGLMGQDFELPPDLRQHNLQWISPSVFNPVFSLDQQASHRLGIWSRWQWQTIDGDPTTVLFNYNARLGQVALGAGFFQNNTEIFQQTGGVFNTAYRYAFNDRLSLSAGVNILIFQQELSDTRLVITEPILPFSDDTRDMILQLAPALQLNYDAFGIGVVFENLLDYSFDYQEAASDDKIILAMAHYTFSTGADTGGGTGQLRPMLYFKRIPGYDSQVGIAGLYTDSRFWVQGGYNSYYGPALGGGVRLFQHLSLGGILEFGSSNSPEGESLTYEMVASYSFGRIDRRKRVVGFDIQDDLKREAEMAAERQRAEEAARQDSLQAVAAVREAEMQRRLDSVETAREAERALALEQTRDSLAIARTREAALAEQQRQRDSSAAAQREAELALERRRDSVQRAEAEALAAAEAEEVTPEAGEKYQEVSREGDLEPGYYLIANVFGTQRYYNAFMQKLRAAGLEPRSFYRSANKYNYVYLRRYNTIGEARRARDSDFQGRYDGDLWILRIR